MAKSWLKFPDMELLLACKEEFHRRLRVYNSWKERNAANRDLAPQRAPLAVYNSANSIPIARPSGAPHVNPALTTNRFFKVPFCHPSDIYKFPEGLFSFVIKNYVYRVAGVWNSSRCLVCTLQRPVGTAPN